MDEIESLIAEYAGERDLVEKVRQRIEDLFGPKEAVSKKINLGQTLLERIEALKPHFAHRQVDIITHIEPAPRIFLPPEIVQKVMDGLIRNAIENTPDGGKVEVGVYRRGKGVLLQIHDYGVGIFEEARKRIFEGFFTTGDIMAYSTKTPFDFNAGGKGADLLRMKIFSERYHFQIEMDSTRCKFIPMDTDVCPGKISQCRHCSQKGDCYRSGETTFSAYFPSVPARSN